jgi:hypothetical protein
MRRYWQPDVTSGRSRSAHALLSAADKNYFLGKMLYVVEYTNLDFDQELELFNRVQKGMALNQAERLQGQAGPWPKLISLYVNDFSSVAACKFFVP